MKLLALDLGERRIGLAFSPGQGLAFPAGTLRRVNRLAEDVRQVLQAARDREAEGIVVGIPYQPGAGPSRTDDWADKRVEERAAKQAQGFARALRKDSDFQVYEVDEAFTSVEAEGLLRDAGREQSRDKASVDEAAAVLILQRFIDQPGRAGPGG